VKSCHVDIWCGRFQSFKGACASFRFSVPQRFWLVVVKKKVVCPYPKRGVGVTFVKKLLSKLYGVYTNLLSENKRGKLVGETHRVLKSGKEFP